VIENRGGAGGIIGTDLVAKAAPDGYTLLLVYVSHATNPTLAAKLPYDTLRDFVPITLVSHEPTLPRDASVRAGEHASPSSSRTQGSARASSATRPIRERRLSARRAFQAGDRPDQHRVRRLQGSGPAAADVVRGHLPYMWSVISIVTPPRRSSRPRRLKGLAIAAERRAPNLPEVPTTAEAGLQDFQVSGWYGLVAPAKTPKAVIDRVHAAAAEGAAERGSTSAPRDVGLAAIGAGPEELDAHIRREIARWDKVLKAAGVQLK